MTNFYDKTPWKINYLLKKNRVFEFLNFLNFYKFFKIYDMISTILINF